MWRSRGAGMINGQLGGALLLALVMAFLGAFIAPAQRRPTPGPAPPASCSTGASSPRRGRRWPSATSPPAGRSRPTDGFLWTVSAGQGANDIRIVDTVRHRVQPDHPAARRVRRHRPGLALTGCAYVSGVALSRWRPSQAGLPGAAGNCVLVYGWKATSGKAQLRPGHPRRRRRPTLRSSRRSRSDARRSRLRPNAWPQKLAVSPDGSRLLVPLNLADSAAVIDLNDADDQVRYVPHRQLPVRRGDPARRAHRPGEQRGLRDACR